MKFKTLLRMMYYKRASDLFMTPGMAPSIKINGQVVAISHTPLTDKETEALTFSTMNALQKKEFQRNMECNYAIDIMHIGRFRVSAYYVSGKVGMVLRRIETRIPTIEELELPQSLKKLSLTKRGLIIFVGATGSGKSSSLAAMLGYRNANSTGHIISIEDPVEYVHRHNGCIITQREVGIDTESFNIALKNALRQAPDVIQIGEIRTENTMDMAISFAETGHLCLATLHANNANQALERIVNFFPKDQRDQVLLNLSLNLKAIIAQQLISRIDKKGRTVACEVMLNTPAIREHIRRGEIDEIKELMTRSNEREVQTFDQSLFKLFNEGKISQEHALQYADSENDVRLMIKLHKEGKGIEASKHLAVKEPKVKSQDQDYSGSKFTLSDD